MIRKYLTIIVLLIPLLFALPHQAQAVSWFPLVPCGLNAQPAGIDKSVHDYTQSCNQCLLIELGKNVIDMTFFAIVPAVGTLLFMVAGFIILFNARDGKPAGVAKGKQIMTDTAIGIVIILASWLITNFILKSIANPQVASTPWYQIQCKVGSLQDITLGALSGGGTSTGTQKYSCNSSNQCALDPNGQYTTNTCDGKCQAAPPPPQPPPGGGDLPPGSCTGVVCSDSSVNVCAANTSANCADTAVNKFDTQIRAAATSNPIGSGIDTVAMVKAIMSQESSGISGRTSYDGTSFGLMQLQPDTANGNKGSCTTDTVTSSWLLNASNDQASICIAINYIKSLIGACGTDVRNLAAGYNGGGAGKGACNASTSCASCSVCGNEQTRRWECPWDGADGVHTACNVDRGSDPTVGSFAQTRKEAPAVWYCYNKFGGTASGGGGNTTAPRISSMSPSSTTAGTEASFDQNTGVDTFTYLDVPFEIKGQNLSGTTVSADNVGVDGKPGIEFKDLKYTDTSITGDMLMHSTAKDGTSNITVTNNKGSAKTSLDIKITGTQYLARKFSNSPGVKFFGRWPGIMPDSAANQSASLVDQALGQIGKDSYKKLNIVAQIYEPGYWKSTAESKYCGSSSQNGFSASGCASPADQIIHIEGESGEIVSTILHESAHKLHFYYLGKYAPAPSQPNDFQTKFRQIVDSTVNSCTYLPTQFVNGEVLYSDANPDTEFIPRCGFLWSYGAYKVVKNSNNNYYEAVATLSERSVSKVFNVNSGDAVTNPQLYNNEYNLLNQYGF